ncbi:hypothetical protein ACIQD3_23770 [Peribacillus loiseleuriae]|uniref:hypothetical protein n=1 Tax=Peribacillus loiseleuriae TaxID=1679170 RepID=UPI003814777F
MGQQTGSRSKRTRTTGAVHEQGTSHRVDEPSHELSPINQEGKDVSDPIQRNPDEPNRRELGGTETKNTDRPVHKHKPSATGYVPKRRVAREAHRGNVIEAPNMRF